MKKIAILAFALVVVLPGCGHRKDQSVETRRNRVERYVDVTANVTEMDDFGDDSEISEFNFDDFSRDEDDEEEDFDLNDLPSDDELNLDMMEEMPEDAEYSWIDAQSDDEFKKMYFSFNHYGIREDQKAALAYDVDQVKQLLSESGSTAQPTVVIEGHACQEGSPAYNLALSEKRAKLVADLFVEAGVDKNAIKVVGRGQECPALVNGKVVNGSRADRWPNRRVEVRVIYT